VTADALARRDSALRMNRQPMMLGRLVLAVPLIMSGVANLPQIVKVGPVSGLAALTIVETGLMSVGLLMRPRYPRRLLLRLLPYMLFLVWAGISTLRHPPDIDGVQNALVYLLFGMSVIFAGSMAARHPIRMQALIDEGLRWVSRIGLALVAVELVVHGLPSREAYLAAPSSWFTGPRSVAALGLLPFCWHLSRWYQGYRSSGIGAMLWVCAMLVSLSRAATAIALLLLCLMVGFQALLKANRALGGVALLLCGVFLATTTILQSEEFNRRVFAGDAGISVGPVRVNASGRMVLWAIVVQSARQHPWVGQGLGSSNRVIGSALKDLIRHPHNDYLRVWHDLGAVGLLLLVFGIVRWQWTLFRSWYRSERAGAGGLRVELLAFLVLFAVSALAIVDNVFIYSFVMAPAGLMIGVGLGSATASEPSGRASARKRTGLR
jgi:O-antigen ligase